jgi:hypothetical protein
MTAPESGNALTEWICGKCGEPLRLSRVNVSYLGSGYPVDLLMCTKCKRALVPPEMALGKMLEVERLLEDK